MSHHEINTEKSEDFGQNSENRFATKSVLTMTVVMRAWNWIIHSSEPIYVIWMEVDFIRLECRITDTCTNRNGCSSRVRAVYDYLLFFLFDAIGKEKEIFSANKVNTSTPLIKQIWKLKMKSCNGWRNAHTRIRP